MGAWNESTKLRHWSQDERTAVDSRSRIDLATSNWPRKVDHDGTFGPTVTGMKKTTGTGMSC
jgi:hypothetical protein